MHLVLAQFSRHQGGTSLISDIKQQVRKSIALALKEAHKQNSSVVVLSSSTLSSQGSEIMDSTEFAELLKDVLLEDLVQNPADQFSCIFIAVQSPQQCEVYNRCFDKWLEKNDVPVATQEASQEVPGAKANADLHVGAGGRLVTTQKPQVDGVTLERWLVSPTIDDDPPGVLALLESDDPGLPWEEYPEAIMEHPLDLINSILQRLGRELHALAKWMRTWDGMFTDGDWSRIRNRGQHGQCRESNHINACESWDPTDPQSKPKFIDEERRIAAVFYGAIMDWAASKGKGLEFWLSADSKRSTIILRASRAVWGKEKSQMDVQFDHEKILGIHTISRSHC